MTVWADKAERGSASLIRLIVWVAGKAGRSFCKLLLYPIVLYFVLTDQAAKKASHEYLTRIYGRAATYKEVFNHFYCFAVTLLDRVFMANGKSELFNITIENQHLVNEARHSAQGCVLLGAHLGSFDLMSLAIPDEDHKSLSIMMRVDPRARIRKIIGIDDTHWNIIPLGEPASFINAYEALNRGGLVAVLADRAVGGASLAIELLGSTALIPVAPYVLAARSGAKTIACFCLFEGGNRYKITFIELDRPASRTSRASELQVNANQYAAVLERYVRLYPLNWFNFYPYWRKSDRA